MLAVSLGLATALLGRASVASPLDRVAVLRSGETVRGRLVAEVPGEYLLLQIGEAFRRIPWSELQPAASPEGPDPNTISIVVESKKSMELEHKPRRGESGDAPRGWEPICTIPCQRRVPRYDVFRVTGQGLDSAEFELPELGARARVQVRPGYSALVPPGATLIVLGGLAFSGGFVYALLTFFGGYEIYGPILLGGAASLVAGGVMVGMGQTGISVDAAPASELTLRLPTRRPIYLTARGLAF